MVLDIEQIKKILPHRHPFLMVDKVLEFDKEEKTLTAIKNVSYNEPIFTGHFPELSIFPGVLQIEMMAQCGGLLAFLLEPELLENRAINLLVKVDEVKFKSLVKPGDRIIADIKVQNRKGPLWVYSCKAYADTRDCLVSEGIINCYQKKMD